MHKLLTGLAAVCVLGAFASAHADLVPSPHQGTRLKSSFTMGCQSAPLGGTFKIKHGVTVKQEGADLVVSDFDESGPCYAPKDVKVTHHGNTINMNVEYPKPGAGLHCMAVCPYQ